MSVTLLQGIVPTEFKTIQTNDILVTGAHIDGFNGVYSLSPTPTINGPSWRKNGLNNYLHTTNSGYRLYADTGGYWILASNVPSPVDANWNYTSNADSWFSMTYNHNEEFPPNGANATFGGQGNIHTAIIPHSPGRVEVIRSLNLNFNGVYDLEGDYKGMPYYRRGDSSYGIIFTDKWSSHPDNPEFGAWDEYGWAIVDDLPPAPISQYYLIINGVTNGWYRNDTYGVTEYPTDFSEYTDRLGNGNQSHLSITEII